MEGRHLVVLCKLSFGDQTIATHALIDCGATGIAFVDEDFARHHQLPLTPLQFPRSLEVINGHPISSGDITHVANTHLSILEHQETLPMFVTKLGHYPIVLGIPWLELHDVAIRFSSRTLTFGSRYCASHCNRTPTVVHAHSLASRVAPGEPAVSAGAGDFETPLSTSPNPEIFFRNEVDSHKDALPETSAFPEMNVFYETGALPETSTVPETSAISTPEASTFWTADGSTPDTAGSTLWKPDASTPDASTFQMADRSTPDRLALDRSRFRTPDGLTPETAGSTLRKPDPLMLDASKPDAVMPDASTPDPSMPDGSKTRLPIEISAIGGQLFR